MRITTTLSNAPARPRPAQVELPKDEGSHPEVKTEWWYLNGYLQDDEGREYGIMHALFDVPDAIHGRYNVNLPWMPGVTALDTGLTQETEGKHSQSQRLHIRRPGTKSEGLTEGRLDQSFTDDNGTWRMRRWNSKTIVVSGPTGEGTVNLKLTEKKPPLLMGGDGEIKMGPHGLSKYVTYPFLEAEGTLTIDGEERRVHGQAWIDHQWGDMQMYNGYEGWDWFGIQLDNDTQINAFRFRNEEGGNSHATVGISHPDGSQSISEDLQTQERSRMDQRKNRLHLSFGMAHQHPRPGHRLGSGAGGRFPGNGGVAPLQHSRPGTHPELLGGRRPCLRHRQR